MKALPKIALIIYSFLLLWLVLFKTSLDIPSVLTEFQTRTLNFIPFTGHLSEMVENILIFIPFGFFISAALKNIDFWKKLFFIFVFSLAIETIQYLLAIGVSDITDIITNTLGGLMGLGIYKICTDRGDTGRRERMFLLIVSILIVICLCLRFFVFKVKY
ncbi:MAG TPA: VanZ family protein [Candidatus Saccharimonadales bacterium]|nr:VanZ family protein [Candidatus Saccharimonadales bacterium]